MTNDEILALARHASEHCMSDSVVVLPSGRIEVEWCQEALLEFARAVERRTKEKAKRK